MVPWTGENESETFPLFIYKVLSWRTLVDFSGVIPDLQEEREVLFPCPWWDFPYYPQHVFPMEQWEDGRELFTIWGNKCSYWL